MSRRKSSAPSHTNLEAVPLSGPESARDDVLERTVSVLSTRPEDERWIRYVRGLPHVLTEWFSDPKYLGPDDRARDLPLHSRGPCLAKLIRRALPHDDIEQVADALVQAKAVRKNGKLYTAISRQVAFVDPQAMRAHSIGSLKGHAAAIQYNIACPNPARRVLEREASNVQIPTRLLGQIHRDIFDECEPLLSALDHLLQSKQVPLGSEPTTK